MYYDDDDFSKIMAASLAGLIAVTFILITCAPRAGAGLLGDEVYQVQILEGHDIRRKAAHIVCRDIGGGLYRDCFHWAMHDFEFGTHPLKAETVIEQFNQGEACARLGFDVFNEETGECANLGDEDTPDFGVDPDENLPAEELGA